VVDDYDRATAGEIGDPRGNGQRDTTTPLVMSRGRLPVSNPKLEALIDILVAMVSRGVDMTRVDIVWSHDAERNAVIACIEDTDGFAWTAVIQSEPYKLYARVVVTLFCRARGRLLSTNSAASLEEAQNWCCQMLEIE
jgi:hypothetical protein